MTTPVKVEKEADLEKLISDYGPSKYLDIVRAMQWARHLRRQEEFRRRTGLFVEALDVDDVIAGLLVTEPPELVTTQV